MRMLKKSAMAILGLIAGLSSFSLSAQIPSGYVQTTATVSSLAGGQFGASWTNLSSSPQLGLLGCVSTFQQTINGTFDASGHFSTLLADPAQICPSPSTWSFAFTYSCPAGSPNSGFALQLPTAVLAGFGGSTVDISSQITAALPANPCNVPVSALYCKLTGCTLTGALNGTSITMSGNINAGGNISAGGLGVVTGLQGDFTNSIVDGGLTTGYVTSNSFGELGYVTKIPYSDLSGTPVGVTQIVAGTNVSISPTGGTGAVTINATGGGSGGVQYNPPNTVYMWGAGDSSISDDGRVYGGSTTATAANCNGTVCIITAPNSYVAGQTIWIDGTWSPSFLNTVTAPEYLGTGHGFYQVISTGLSSTQFEFAYTSASGTGTGGTVRDTSYMVPFLSGSMPFLNGHGTTIVEAGQESGQGFSIQASLDNFSALYGSYAPNVTGNPGFFFISGWRNDVGALNESASTVVSNIQSLMALAHASGWQVVAMTEWTSVNGGTMALSYMAQINSDILQLGKTNANASSGQYWDYIVDAASGVTDTSLTYTPSTVPFIAAKVNEAFASQKSATTGLSTMFSLDTGPYIWRLQGNNGLEICAANNTVCALTVNTGNGSTTSVNNFDETQTASVNDRGGTGIGSPILVSNPSPNYPTGVTEYFPSLSAGKYGSMLYAFDYIGDYFSLHMENTGSASIFGISGSPEFQSTPTDLLQVFANGNVAIPTKAPFAGYAACFTTGGTMGHCTSIIGATGTCTCVTP